jgi:predicted dithiol-disulfide oxidoreductase (DUF899 family)
MSLPRVLSRDEWVVARQQLLAREKALTRCAHAPTSPRRARQPTQD